MKFLVVFAFASMFTFKSASAQTAINADTKSAISDTTSRPLYILVERRKTTILDTAYTLDPAIINGIYFLQDKQKAIEKFGEKGKNGVFLISPQKEYISKFLKTMGIHYDPNEKDPYTQRASSTYQ